MRRTSLRLAPSVPDLRALGAETVEDLLGTGRPLREEHRAEPLAEDRSSWLVRVPLPGTPCAEGGPPSGRPAGAGTGWVRLRRYRGGGLRAMLAARLTRPRSESFAEREWNLLCHLRAAGVAVPEPLAVGSAGAGPFRRRSFVVTRELEGESAPGWLAAHRSGVERRRAVRALGTALGRLLRSGVRLPALRAADLVLVPPAAPPPGVGRRAPRPTPTVALARVAGGSIRPRPSVEDALATLRRVLPARSGGPLSERELLRVFLLATRGWSAGARRAALRRLASVRR